MWCLEWGLLPSPIPGKGAGGKLPAQSGVSVLDTTVVGTERTGRRLLHLLSCQMSRWSEDISPEAAGVSSLSPVSSPQQGCPAGCAEQRLQKSQLHHLLHQILPGVFSILGITATTPPAPQGNVQVLLSHLPPVSLGWEPSRPPHSPVVGRAFLAGASLGKPWPPCPQKGNMG